MSSQQDKEFFYNPVVYHIGLLALFIGGNIALYHFTPVDSWWGLLILLFQAGIGISGEGLKNEGLRVNCVIPLAGTITWFICTTFLADQGNLCWILYALGGLLQSIYVLVAVNCREEGYGMVCAILVGLLFYSIKFTNHEVGYSVLAVAISIIIAIAVFIFSAIDFVGEYGVKAINAAVKFVKWIEQEFLTEEVVRDRVSSKCPEAFKAKIMAKKKNAVNLRIFDKFNTPIEDVGIECPNGVSDSLKVKDMIPIRNY